MNIFLCNLGGFDFELTIGGGPPGLIGNYLHRYIPLNKCIIGVVPLYGINLDELTENDLPFSLENFPFHVEHNIEELNKHFSLYKFAFQEAKKYLILL